MHRMTYGLHYRMRLTGCRQFVTSIMIAKRSIYANSKTCDRIRHYYFLIRKFFSLIQLKRKPWMKPWVVAVKANSTLAAMQNCPCTMIQVTHQVALALEMRYNQRMIRPNHDSL